MRTQNNKNLAQKIKAWKRQKDKASASAPMIIQNSDGTILHVKQYPNPHKRRPSFNKVPSNLAKVSTTEKTRTRTQSKSTLMNDLEKIQRYISNETERINKAYDGDTAEYLKGMLAYNVGHMVLNTNYKNLTIKTIDHLFGQFDTTFEEVKEEIRRDMSWENL